MLVAIEGIDGSGKTTLIEGLKKHFQNKFEFVKDPGGYSEDSLSMKIRTLLMNTPDISPECQALLFNAARLDTLQKLKSENVIFDRYIFSTIAYQYGGLDGNIYSIVDGLNSVLSCSGSFKLDFVIYLNIDPELAADRLDSRNVDNGKHFEKLEIQKKVHSTYESIAHDQHWCKPFFKDYRKNILVIDALQSPEEILQLAIKAIEDVL